jgi:hypothetical protein
MVLGSGIRDPEKTYSGSRIQGSKSTQSRIRIRKTGADPDSLGSALILEAGITEKRWIRICNTVKIQELRG